MLTVVRLNNETEPHTQRTTLQYTNDTHVWFVIQVHITAHNTGKQS